MHALPILAILGSALLHATWNAVLKRRKDTTAAAMLLVVGAGLISAVLTFAVGPADVPAGALPWVGAVALSEGLYFFFLSKSLQELPLGSAYGLSRGGGLLVTWPISIALLSETINARILIGGGVLTLGLFVSVTTVGSRKGLMWTVLCACMVGLYPVFYKQSLGMGVSPYPLFCLSLLGSVPIQVLLLGAHPWARLRNELRVRPLVLALTCAVTAASFLLLLWALRFVGAGRITALRNTSVLFAYAFGWLAGERLTARSAIASVAITVGAVLLSL
ncbi:MAG: EamA family transporter [Deltaproteobacteria bacterium]|nr:EamA family transporter [Deltaproteobacteria bacterium]